MNFQTDTVTSSFDASASMNAMQGERDGQRTGNLGSAYNAMVSNGQNSLMGWATEQLGFGGYDSSVVGINVNEINSMINAITDYCNAIETYLRDLNPAADSELAFKGEEVKAALNTYMENVKAYCINLVSQLLAFNDKLRDVRNQWQQYTSNLAGNINSTAGQYATGTRYTESIQ